MSDVAFDILIKSVADSAAIDRMRNTVRGMRTDLAGVNEMLAQNRGNFSLSSWGDRLDISKVKSASDSTKALGNAGQQVNFGFREAAGAMLGFTSVAGAVATVAFGVTATISSLNRGVSQLADEVDRVTTRTGINGETYQAWKIVLEDAGQDVGVLVSALDRLKQVIGDAGAGSVPAQQLLARVGLTAAALKNADIATAMEAVSRGLRNITGEAERAAAAQDFFGRGSSALNPLLEKFADGTLPRLQEQLKNTGEILTNDTVRALDDAGDRIAASGRKATVGWAPLVTVLKQSWAEIGGSLSAGLSEEGLRGEISAIDYFTGTAHHKMVQRAKDSVSRHFAANPMNWSGEAALRHFQERTASPSTASLPATPPSKSNDLTAIEAAAKAELEAKAAKERLKVEVDNEIALAAARKADLQARIASGNALFLEAEEQKRLNALKAKQVADAEAERQLNDALNAQTQRRADLEADWRRTSLEKRPELLASLREEMRLIDERTRKLQEERGLADPLRRGQIDGELSGLSGRRGDINRQMGSPSPYSLGEQFSNTSNQLSDQVGTVPQQMAQAYGSAAASIRSSMQSAFVDIARGNLSLGDAVKGTPAMLGGAFMAAGAQMAADWAWKHVVMAGISKAWHALQISMHGTSEAAKTATTSAGAAVRMGIVSGETAHDVSMTGVKVVTHGAGEGAKTGTTLIGSIARRGIMIGETVFHGIQVTLRTGAHLVGEGLKTAASVIGMGVRIPMIIAESLAHVFMAGAGALAAMAHIPFVGPALAVAAMGAVVAAGVGLVGKIGKHADGTIIRGPGTGTSDSVLARLSAGEAVIPATRVNQYGESFIQGLIDGRPLPSRTMMAPVTAAAENAQGASGTNINIGVALDAHFAAQLVGSKPGRKIVTRVQSEGLRELGWES